jgi:integrase
MITRTEGTLLNLTGGVQLKKRVQHPKVQQCRDREMPYWFFRYWHDELRPDGTVKTTRKREIIGPSNGPNAFGKKEAESRRDAFLANLNAAPSQCEAAVFAKAPVEIGAILFGKLAELWRLDFVEREIGGRGLIAKSTRAKYINHLENHILPRWKDTRLAEFKAKAVFDWLLTECDSWYVMADLRNIMSGIFSKAQDWEILPDTFANPMRRVKLPRKFEVREKRLLTEDETARVLARLEDPHRLICETCLDTGTRISEATALQVKHVNFEKGTIRIDQRNWRGDIDEPKTTKSRRTLALGTLAERYRTWIGNLRHQGPEAWVFPQDDDKTQPMWDSGVRKALKIAAADEDCDFLGLGPHSLRRANITWRQEVGASSIEASRIAGQSSTKITEEYTIVQLKRQEDLTRRLQAKRTKAGKRASNNVVVIKPDVESVA